MEYWSHSISDWGLLISDFLNELDLNNTFYIHNLQSDIRNPLTPTAMDI